MIRKVYIAMQSNNYWSLSNLRVASCKLRVASCELQVASWKLHLQGLQVAIYKLKISSFNNVQNRSLMLK